MTDEKYTVCNVCGDEMGPDRLHVVIDNGRVTRHTYCCRRHRYVVVEVKSDGVVYARETQMRSDLEIESLAFSYRLGELKKGWE